MSVSVRRDGRLVGVLGKEEGEAGKAGRGASEGTSEGGRPLSRGPGILKARLDQQHPCPLGSRLETHLLEPDPGPAESERVSGRGPAAAV